MTVSSVVSHQLFCAVISSAQSFQTLNSGFITPRNSFQPGETSPPRSTAPQSPSRFTPTPQSWITE